MRSGRVNKCSKVSALPFAALPSTLPGILAVIFHPQKVELRSLSLKIQRNNSSAALYLYPLIDGGNKCCAQTKGQKSVSQLSLAPQDVPKLGPLLLKNERGQLQRCLSCHLQLLLITAAVRPFLRFGNCHSSLLGNFKFCSSSSLSKL